MKKHHLRNDIKFARYGSLNPIKHKKYVKNKLNNKLPDAELWDKNIGYHSPPARYGIYAFVYPSLNSFFSRLLLIREFTLLILNFPM